MDVIIDHEFCDASSVKRVAATLKPCTSDSIFHCLYFTDIPITERYSLNYYRFIQKVWKYINECMITG
jgi:hypothetical protein